MARGGWWSTKTNRQRAALVAGCYVFVAGALWATAAARSGPGFITPLPSATSPKTPAPKPSAPAGYWPEERESRRIGRCTITIPPSVDHVEGDGDYSHIKPGDVLCLPAGRRGTIVFSRLHGTADAPITIRNSRGVVKITGATSKRGGIGLIRSSWVRVSGAGVSTKCGARYEPAEQECGIEISRTHQGVKVWPDGGVDDFGDVHDIEIDHVYIHSTLKEIHSTGIMIQPQPGQTISGFFAHDNHVADTHREGMYIGAEPYDRPFAMQGKLANVEISSNLVERTGYDGIKVKVVIEGLLVHDNIVRDPALEGFLYHESGILLATSAGAVYNNLVQGGTDGIKTGRPLPAGEMRVFNNVVVGTLKQGLLIAEDAALVHHNTIIQSGTIGIEARGQRTQVFDNIAVGSGEAPFLGRNATGFENLIGPVSAARFIDADAGNYHLRPRSPAVGDGETIGVFPALDFDRVARPQGASVDSGAFEYRRNAPAGTR